MAQLEDRQDYGDQKSIPKKLQRMIKKLEAAGEKPIFIAPAILQGQSSKHMQSIARIGLMDKILSYLVITGKNVHLIRPGFAWDKIQTIPLEKIDGIEYVEDFFGNTLAINMSGRKENIIFYDDKDGIVFFHYIKFKQWNE